MYRCFPRELSLTTKLKGVVFSFGPGVLACERRGECNLGKNVHLETVEVSQISAFHWERCSHWINSVAELCAKKAQPTKEKTKTNPKLRKCFDRR